MAYVCQLEAGHTIYVEQQGDQTSITVLQTGIGQQQQSRSSFRTGAWVESPQILRSSQGVFIKLITHPVETWVQVQGQNLQAVSKVQGIEQAQQLQVSQVEKMPEQDRPMEPMQPMKPLQSMQPMKPPQSMQPIEPMTPMPSMEMGNMRMDLSSMQMQMGEMQMQMGKQSPEVHEPLSEQDRTQHRFCTQCGQPILPSDRFCGACGHELQK